MTGGPRAANRLHILLAEDDAELRSLLAIVLRRDGHRIREVRDGTQLVSELAGTACLGAASAEDLLVIADLKLPFTDSLAVIRGLGPRERLPNFILMTAFGSEKVRQEATALGVLAVFDKPFDFDDMREAVLELASRPRSS